MAIENSTLEIDGKKYHGYFKILRIWGDKQTGRTALIGYAQERTAAEKGEWILQFEHTMKWQKGDPYEAMYQDLKRHYLCNPLSTTIDDIKELFS